MEAKQDSASCPACGLHYDNDNPPRRLPACSHPLCDRCLRLLIKDIIQIPCTLGCPVEGRDIAFSCAKTLSAFPIDRELLTKSTSLGQASNIDLKLGTTTSIANNCVPPPLLNITNTTKATSKVTSPRAVPKSPRLVIPRLSQTLPETMCLVHQKPLDIVCTTDLTVICSNCAIFAHKNHAFKTFKDFNNDKIAYCLKLEELTKSKEDLQQRLNTDSQQDKMVHKAVDKKRKQLLAHLKKKFQRLHECLNVVENQCSGIITQQLSRLTGTLLKQFNVPNSLITQIRNWETVVEQQMKVFEGFDFEAQMKCLNYSFKEKDIMQEGKELLKKIEIQRQHIGSILKKQESLGNLSLCIKQTEIEKLIYSVLDKEIISDQSKSVLMRKDSFKTQMARLLRENTARGTTPLWQETIDEVSLLDTSNEKSFMVETACTQPYLGEPIQESKCNTTFGQGTSNKITQFLQPTLVQSQLIFAKEVPTCQPRNSFNNSRWLTGSPPAKESALFKKTLARVKSETSVLPTTVISSRSILSNDKKKPDDALLQAKKLLQKFKIDSKGPSGQKYTKIMVGLVKDQLQVLDLSCCDLEQQALIQVIDQVKKCSNVRCIKLMKNKLTDEFIERISKSLYSVTTLNLSQNLLTQKTFGSLFEDKQRTPYLKSIVLSLNKIKPKDKQVKAWMDRLKQAGITVTI